MAPLSILLGLAALVLAETAPAGDTALETNDSKSSLSVKILDAAFGKPANNMIVEVYKQTENGSWIFFADGKTSTLGEISDLLTDEEIGEGLYKVKLCSWAYWKKASITPFYENVQVIFKANQVVRRNYVIAALLSPYSHTISAVVNEPVN
ncbi:transthyretin-like [Lissotriton helveticus]